MPVAPDSCVHPALGVNGGCTAGVNGGIGGSDTTGVGVAGGAAVLGAAVRSNSSRQASLWTGTSAHSGWRWRCGLLSWIHPAFVRPPMRLADAILLTNISLVLNPEVPQVRRGPSWSQEGIVLKWRRFECPYPVFCPPYVHVTFPLLRGPSVAGSWLILFGLPSSFLFHVEVHDTSPFGSVTHSSSSPQNVADVTSSFSVRNVPSESTSTMKNFVGYTSPSPISPHPRAKRLHPAPSPSTASRTLRTLTVSVESHTTYFSFCIKGSVRMNPSPTPRPAL